MTLTTDNYKETEEKQLSLLHTLLLELEEINNNSPENRKLFITWQDYHDESEDYPDYYGTYRIHFQDSPTECLGLEMDIKELDSALCVISDYIVHDSGK